MDALYRFSPIKNQVEIIRAVNYVVTQSSRMCLNILKESLPIERVTIFSHYTDEFDQLKTILLEMGEFEKENNGPFVKLKMPLNISDQTIKFLRIRQPDPYRMQVGCNDFEVDNYETFKEKYLTSKADNLRLFVRSEYEMIEFFDPDYDVLGYVVSNE